MTAFNNTGIDKALWNEALSMAKDQLRHGMFYYTYLEDVTMTIYNKLRTLQEAHTIQPDTVPGHLFVQNNADQIPKIGIDVANIMKPKVQMVVSTSDDMPRMPFPSKNPQNPTNKKRYINRCNAYLKEIITKNQTVVIHDKGNRVNGLTNRFRVTVSIHGHGGQMTQLDLTRVVAASCGMRYSKRFNEVYIHGCGSNFMKMLTEALSIVVFGKAGVMRYNAI